MMLRRTCLLLAVVGTFVACAAQEDQTAATDQAVDVARHRDAGPSTTDAGSPTDDGGADDGTPTRVPCTSNFGSGLVGGTHGRLDGTLVSIVPPASQHSCNDDPRHLHLQISMDGGVYDIAMNIAGVLTAERDAALADEAWSEGWHPGDDFDFPTTMGLHSSDFSPVQEQEELQHVEDLLANVNHISVFATKYSTGGAHLIHRQGNGNDGALVLYPLSGAPHYVMFSFPRQSF